MALPTMTQASPSMMHRRRPIGIPINISANERTVAARTYDEATIGITYVPVGFYSRRLAPSSQFSMVIHLLQEPQEKALCFAHHREHLRHSRTEQMTGIRLLA
jgi:hypothetical protein